MAPNDLLSAHKSLQDFLAEARHSAECCMGFAAMLTSLPVIFAVGEAETGEDQLKKQISAFLNSSPSYESWLIHDPPSLAQDAVRDVIYDLRNALAHNASMPNNTFLVISGAEIKMQKGGLGAKRVIGVKEFISAIESYLSVILTRCPQVQFDPIHGGARGPAEGGMSVFTAPASGTAGSGKP